MKKLIIALVLMMSAGTVVAQSKIAHVNSQKILDSMPSRKDAIAQLETISASGEEELVEMETNLRKMSESLEATRSSKTPLQIKLEEEKLQRKYQELQRREQEIQQDLSRLSNELNAPIVKRLQDAVDIVAERKKLNYVVDASSTLYSKGGTDITNEVITEVLRLEKESKTTPSGK